MNHDNINEYMDENAKMKFYTDLIDRIHFWLYHQFDVGMRVKRSYIDLDDNKNGDVTHDDFIYDEFAEMRKKIVERRDKWKMQHSSSNSNEQCKKYKLPIETAYSHGDRETTYMDSLFEELKRSNISTMITTLFRKFLRSEQYDTDAIIADIIDSKKDGSNITNIIDQDDFIRCIHRISDDHRLNVDGVCCIFICMFLFIACWCSSYTNSTKIQLWIFLVLLGFLQR